MCATRYTSTMIPTIKEQHRTNILSFEYLSNSVFQERVFIYNSKTALNLVLF